MAAVLESAARGLADAGVRLREAYESLLVAKLAAACRATGVAAMAWGEVAYIMGGPPVRVYWAWQVSLGARELCIEAALLGALLLAYQMRRWLRKKKYFTRLGRWGKRQKRALRARYDRFVEWVSHKSKLAATSVPHVCFLVVVYVVSYFFPETARSMSLSPNLEVFVILARVLGTVFVVGEVGYLGRSAETGAPRAPRAQAGENAAAAASASEEKGGDGAFATPTAAGGATRRTRGASSANGTPSTVALRAAATPATPRSGTAEETIADLSRSLDDTLMYWVVFAIIITTQRVSASIPFVGAWFKANPRLSWVYGLLLLWLQLPFGGVKIAYSVLVPLIEKYAGRVQTPKVPDAAQTNMILRALVFSRVLTSRQCDFVIEVCRDGWILLIGAAFIFTPSFFTHKGCLMAGESFVAMHAYVRVAELREAPPPIPPLRLPPT